MKKLFVKAPYHGELENNLRYSSLFEEFPQNEFLYQGCLDPHDKVSSLISEYHFKEFGFMETEHCYRLRVWEE